MSRRKSQQLSERRLSVPRSPLNSAELPLGDSSSTNLLEEYRLKGSQLLRQVRAGTKEGPWMGMEISSPVSGLQDDLRAAWDQAFLQGKQPELLKPPQAKLRVVDLFAGCGAMSFGLKCAAEALDYEFVPCLAAELNEDIFEIYSGNLRPQTELIGDLSGVVDYECDESPDARSFKKLPKLTSPEFISLQQSGVDVLIGGPPCQGHSNLNNHSRRDDPKNALYLLMPALAYCLKPKALIVENVRAVIHDKQQVVQRTKSLLKGMGYHVDDAVVQASSIGVPQSRQRHILVAVQKPARAVYVKKIIEALSTTPRTVGWALAGINPSSPDPIFDKPSKLSEQNKKRVEWLFKNKEFDLPNPERPACHRDKEHSYKSMYGRMKWNEPAQTITSGFGSPGQGRFIHPGKQRLITPHEAARLQFFPDSFRFIGKSGTPKRTRLTEMIGNAVPPKLAYVIGLGVLGALP